MQLAARREGLHADGRVSASTTQVELNTQARDQSNWAWCSLAYRP